jgi:hypothetical protein
MNEKSSNEGVVIIAEFTDRVIPLTDAVTSQDTKPLATKSENPGIIPFAEFNDKPAHLDQIPNDSKTADKPSKNGDHLTR